MTDLKIRALGRSSLASGSVDDRARWIQARIRAGTLDRDKLALLLRAGDRAVADLVPPASLDDLTRPRSRSRLLDWVRRLRAFGVQAQACAAYGVVRFSRESAGVAGSDGLTAVGQWLSCPCPDHRAALVRGLPNAALAGSSTRLRILGAQAAGGEWALAAACLQDQPEGVDRLVGVAVSNAARLACMPPGKRLWPALHAAACGALRDWALA